MTSFFRLPIISFIVTFCLLFILLVLKLNDISQQSSILQYNYSPDFMRIIGFSLYTMLVMSICLHHIQLYTVTIRNGVFIIGTVVMVILITYWCDIYLTDLFAYFIDLNQAAGYRIFLFWFPILSRILALLITFFIIKFATLWAKTQLKWGDEACATDLNLAHIKSAIQLIYLIGFYLAICFIFQRYLYIAVYLFLGGGDLPELYNFSFYLAATVTTIMLVMYIKQKDKIINIIDVSVVIKTVLWILLSQLLLSIVISLVIIYGIQWFFTLTAPSAEGERFSHYISLIYAMLNSIFIVSLLTSLVTYFAGRFWLKKSHYLT